MEEKEKTLSEIVLTDNACVRETPLFAGDKEENTDGDTAESKETLVPPAEGLSTDSKRKKKRGKRKKRLKFYQITPENDIKYRGPLSYRALRIAGWVCLAIAQVATIWSMVGKINPQQAMPGVAQTVLGTFGDMMMPLFLIATFATILNGSKNFRSMLVLYGSAAVLFYALFVLVFDRYATGSISAIMEIDRKTSQELLVTLLSNFTGGYLAFNIFIDLFMCTLFACFLMYTPKRVFVGKKLVVFRLFAILPILYEVMSFLLKMLAGYGLIELSAYIYPLLTTKPPMTFILFIVLTFYLKRRERIYRKKGGTHEQYSAFLKTNANSWRVSSFMARIMAIAGVVDLILFVVMSAVLMFGGISEAQLTAISELSGDAAAEASVEMLGNALTRSLDVMMKCGVGQSSGLIIVAPFILLFSYTRTHKDTRIDTILPIIAIVILALMYIEGLYQVIKAVGGKLQDFLQLFFAVSGGGE